MKKINCLLFALISVVMANATASPQRNSPFAEPSASLQKMWVDYEATVGSRYGMMIHISFTAYDMKGVNAYLGAYFKFNDGQPNNWIIHTGKHDTYHASNGTLGIGRDITPTYDASVYEDIQLFMPYDEFNLDPGTYDITIDVQLLYKTGGTIAWLKQYEIEFTEYGNNRSSNNTKPRLAKTHLAATQGPRATYDSMWVDFNVKENGVLGMMLHFKFVAWDMKDKEAFVAIYFEHNDAVGAVLKDNNKKLYSTAGDVALYKSITPGYAETYYDDLQVFMPYDELDLSPGTYELLMDTKLIHKEGGLISNFSYYGFKYTEPK